MDVPFMVFSGWRRIIFLSLDQASSTSVGRPFVTLLPAFDERERRQAEAMAGLLMDRGSVEFCCVGPESELLHDSIDEVIERRGALDVVTTWHTDYDGASRPYSSGDAADPTVSERLLATREANASRRLARN